MKPLLRNDDVCAATTAKHLQKFTELTDKHGYRVIHAITPRGICWASDSWLGSKKNSEILALGAGITIEQNTELIEFLRSRTQKDLFGIHGLWHIHKPSVEDWLRAHEILMKLGLYPLYLVPPFNEGNFKSHDFFVSGTEAPSFEVEDYPADTEIVQMHSWRYDPELWQGSHRGPWWTWDDLEQRLDPSYGVMMPSETNDAKYAFLAPRITGKWIDIGCNVGRLLGMVPGGVGVERSSIAISRADEDLHILQGDAASLDFPDNTFDTAVLCSVLEQCEDWRNVLTEALRVVKPGGRVIGTAPYPGTKYGTLGAVPWVKSVISISEFPNVELITQEHYYFEVRK